MARLSVSITAALVLAIGACTNTTAPNLVASVDGEPLVYQGFSEYVEANVGRRAEALDSEVLQALFDEFLDEIIARRIAAQEVPAGTPRERAFEVWIDGLPVEDPSQEEVLQRFQSDVEARLLPRRVILRQIVTETFEQAFAVRQEILAGAPFAAVADRLAQHQFAPAGGLQGVLTEQDLPRNVAQEVFALPEATVSSIVEMEFGFAVFQVDQFLQEEQLEFANMHDRLHREMTTERRQQRLSQRVHDYRTAEHVTIYPGNLPFDYQGAYRELANEAN